MSISLDIVIMEMALEYKRNRNLLLVVMIISITLLGMVLLIIKPETFWQLWLTRILNILAVAFIIFFNITTLIPDYLKSRGWLAYGLSILVFLTIFSPLRIVFLYYLYGSSSPDSRQVLLEEQGLYYLADFLIIFLSTSIKLSIDWVWNQRRLSKLEKQHIQSEIKFLKAQINPHFLFNTLNNIYALSLKNDPNTPEVILKLSGILRYILYECNEKEVALEKEWEHIENYVALEKIRLSTPVKLELDVQIKTKEFRIAPLILMTFVENAFKHGLKSQNENTFISIRIFQEDQQMHFRIINSKLLINPTEEKEQRGIGLDNIKKRLELLYPDQYTLKIENQPDTYKVDLQIDKKIKT